MVTKQIVTNGQPAAGADLGPDATDVSYLIVNKGGSFQNAGWEIFAPGTSLSSSAAGYTVMTLSVKVRYR